MAFQKIKLPYNFDALSPYLSEKTMDFHYNKHHQGYIDKLNELVKDTDLENQALDDVIQTTHQNDQTKIFNSAAQAWNHNFFWQSIKPNGGGEPIGDIKEKILQTFDSYENFKKEFTQAAVTLFGSGWVWLVLEGTRLKITQTSNADLPFIYSQQPLLTLDVWEHAYYLDYQNRRPDFIKAFLDHLINWNFAENNLQRLHY